MRSRRAGTIVLGSLLLLAQGTATAASLEVTVRNTSEKPGEYAVVVAKPVGGAVPTDAGSAAVIDQVDKEYVPYVTAVQVGTKVNFPNHDPVRHHVYSFSEAKSFELPLYKGSAHPPITFDTPGVVVLGCNIHDSMRGYIRVTDTPYAMKTNRNASSSAPPLASSPTPTGPKARKTCKRNTKCSTGELGATPGSGNKCKPRP